MFLETPLRDVMCVLFSILRQLPLPSLLCSYVLKVISENGTDSDALKSWSNFLDFSRFGLVTYILDWDPV